MKKVFHTLLSLLLALSLCFGMTACGGEQEPPAHTHALPAGAQYTSTQETHSYICSCGERITEPHVFGGDNVCDVCGYEAEQPQEHEHAKPEGTQYIITQTTHGYVCSCGVTVTEEHKFDASDVCTVCGYRAHEHARPDGASLTPSDTGHSYVCSCGETIEEVHDFDAQNVCRACGYELAPSEGLSFAENGDTYALSGIGTFAGGQLRIPYYHQGKPVTEISEKAFFQNATVTSVLIPDSVSSIGNSAFEGCTALRSVTLGAGLSALQKNIFKDCAALESVKISENCTTLGNHIKTSTNPGDYMFRNCVSLTSVDLPESLLSIGNYAFYDCSALETVTGGEGLGQVGKDIVSGTAYYARGENWQDGILYIGAAAVGAETDIRTANIRPGTVTLARCLFWKYYPSLRSVTLPEGVRYIGYYAFSECPALEEVSLPSSLEYIYYYVFEGSENIKTVRYAGDLHGWHSIKAYYEPAAGYELYFGGKPAAITYTISADVHSYVCDTCGETVSAEHVFGGDLVCTVCGYAWDKQANGSHGLYFKLNDDGGSYSLWSLWDCTDKDVVIPASYQGKPVTKVGIGSSIFTSYQAKADLDSITIPASVTEIDSYAFDSDDYTIAELVIPNTVTTLAEAAFGGAAVGKLVFEEGSSIKEISDWCFFTIACKELRLPDSAEELGGKSFHYAEIDDLYIGKELKSYLIGSALSETFGFAEIGNVVIDEENPNFIGRGNCIIGKETKILYTAFNNSVIPDDGSVEEIGAYAFQDLKIESVTIPSSVKRIGKFAFGDDGTSWQECPLKEVVFQTKDGNGVQIISRGAFRNCEMLKEITLPDTLLTIGEEAFLNCGIERITIPASVNAIYENAFKSCPIMTAARTDKSVMQFKTPLDLWKDCDIKADDAGAITDILEKSTLDNVQEDWAYHLRQCFGDAIIRDLQLFKASYDPDQSV